MSAEIIDFSATAQRRNEVARARAEKLKTIRSMAQERTTKLSLDDAQEVAYVVNTKFKELKNRRIKIREIEGAHRRRGHNAKHIERLRVKAKEDRTVNVEKLNRKPEEYIFLLETLAHLLSVPADGLIWEAFRNTSLCAKQANLSLSPAKEFSWLIHEMAGYVVRECKIGTYLSRLTDAVGSYHHVQNAFIHDHRSPFTPYANGYEGFFELWEMAPPFPAVDLVRVPRMRLVGPLLIETTPIAPAALDAGAVASLIGTTKADVKSVITVDAELTVSTDVRLVLGPMTAVDNIGPLFESRTHISISVGDLKLPITLPYSLWSLSDGFNVAAIFDGAWRRIGGVGANRWQTASGGPHCKFTGDLIESLFNSETGAIETHYVHWDPVNGENVERLVTLANGAARTELQSKGSRTKTEAYRFGSGLGQSIEADLADGTLELNLIKHANYLQNKFEVHWDELRNRLGEEDNKLISHWHSNKT